MAQQLDVAAPARRLPRRPWCDASSPLTPRVYIPLTLHTTSRQPFTSVSPPTCAGSGLDTVLEGHRDAVQAVALLADHRIVSGSRDGTLRIWRDTEARRSPAHSRLSRLWRRPLLFRVLKSVLPLCFPLCSVRARFSSKATRAQSRAWSVSRAPSSSGEQGGGDGGRGIRVNSDEVLTLLSSLPCPQWVLRRHHQGLELALR